MYTAGTLLAGKYELLEVAGQGGMATVWRARARGAGSFSRLLAVKVMLARLCNDPHFVELFVEEARVSSQFQHPNVVQVFDFGEHQGLYFLAMEWVDGLDLLDYARSFFEQGYFMPWAALATVTVEVLKGLHAAHAHVDGQGRPSPIFHRDVTPHNILLGVNGVVKLTDFGLAKATDRGTLTLPHVLKGKISYTAPEMTRGVRANERTDIFSLGVTLWEALTGRKMFDAASPLQIVRQIQNWNVPPLEELRPDLPPELLRIVARAIAREPEQRFASAQEMAQALSKMLPSMPDLPRLGRTVADARQRLAKAPPQEDFDKLKEALRPSGGAAQTPSFRASNNDGRAARVSRNQPAASPPAASPPAASPPAASPPAASPAAPSPHRAAHPPAAHPPAAHPIAAPPPVAAARAGVVIRQAPAQPPAAMPERESSVPPSRVPILPPEPSGRAVSVKVPASEVKISERAPDDFSVVFDDRPVSTKPSAGVEPRPRPSEPSLLDISIELDLGSGAFSRPPIAIPPAAAPGSPRPGSQRPPQGAAPQPAPPSSAPTQIVHSPAPRPQAPPQVEIAQAPPAQPSAAQAPAAQRPAGYAPAAHPSAAQAPAISPRVPGAQPERLGPSPEARATIPDTPKAKLLGDTQRPAGPAAQGEPGKAPSPAAAAASGGSSARSQTQPRPGGVAPRPVQPPSSPPAAPLVGAPTPTAPASNARLATSGRPGTAAQPPTGSSPAGQSSAGPPPAGQPAVGQPPAAPAAPRPPGGQMSARSTTNRGLGPPPGSVPPPSSAPSSITAPPSSTPNKARTTTAPQASSPSPRSVPPSSTPAPQPGTMRAVRPDTARSVEPPAPQNPASAGARSQGPAAAPGVVGAARELPPALPPDDSGEERLEVSTLFELEDLVPPKPAPARPPPLPPKKG